MTERFTRAPDGKTLKLVATFDDPWSLREPLVLNKIWAWSPTSQIAARGLADILALAVSLRLAGAHHSFSAVNRTSPYRGSPSSAS